MKLCVWRGWSSPTSLSSHHCSSPLIKCSSSPSGPSTLSGRSAARIGRRWAEYQGADDWARLLDPLDDTLRSEILRYGEFARAAYSAFDADPCSPSFAACRFPKHSLLRRAGLSRTGYRVTRHLHATTAAAVPQWIADAGAPSALSRRSSWIGYIAACRDEAEIARLGRRDVVIALRGTATFLEWIENSQTSLTGLDSGTSDKVSEPMVERGFWNLFTTAVAPHGSLRAQVREEVGRIVDAAAATATADAYPLSFTVTGHSLGAALAVLAAHDIADTVFRGCCDSKAMVTAISFGGPRIGNEGFRRRVEGSGCKVLRIVNAGDVVTKVPGFVVESEDDDGGGWWRRATTALGWAYADVGRELRLRGGGGCGGRGSANLVECHDLGLYLDQVNQLGATCH